MNGKFQFCYARGNDRQDLHFIWQGIIVTEVDFTVSSFHTINMLWRKSVMKLLFLQQQKIQELNR